MLGAILIHAAQPGSGYFFAAEKTFDFGHSGTVIAVLVGGLSLVITALALLGATLFLGPSFLIIPVS